MKTSIIILTYDNLFYSKLCIDSIRKNTRVGTYEIIVVDNNSTDGTVEWLKKQKDIKVIFNKENMGFPKGCNQGINISKGDNILFLNNDVVVTHNWLDNLIKALYSSKNIGAVGAVTNKCSNYQTIDVTYNSLEEMSDFASKYNVSDIRKWEERLRLIGYCFLVKREVVERVGELDEVFTPGNCEDNDYSLRIRREGYRLILCKDTFIHHFGSVSFKKYPQGLKEILDINNSKFKKKWGIDVSYFKMIRKDITAIIKKSKKIHLNILHIGCGAGGTLLDIKNEKPKCNLYGIEENERAVVNTDHFAKIHIGKEGMIKRYPKSFFDYIIVNSYNKNIDYFSSIFKIISVHLKDSGAVIFELPKKEVKLIKNRKNDFFEKGISK
ncbi:glycosyltransferase [Wukongibacter sp. M2B1]|uniref:glycosyltransferase n=1 Tax=Wukongibacter sp. M2B1 TaxID=3088895 RepID=UPI003D7A643A